MNDFFPFIYEPHKKSTEPEPEHLYIEIAPPREKREKEKKDESQTEERGVIIIQL